jgi:hypothetical protein
MALSGSISTSAWYSSSNKPYKVTLYWTATQDVTNNTSTISWNLKMDSAGSGGWVMVSELRVKFAGEQIYYRSHSNHTEAYNGTQLASGTKVIQHNADGSKSFTATVEAGIYQWAINKSGSGTITLNTIPRASSVSCTTVNIGAKPTITISRASSAFTHTLKYAFGSLSGTIVEKTSATTYNSWTIPTTFYGQIPNAKSGKGTITCETYNGSTLIGTKTCSFTANVSGSAPTLSPNVYDNNSTTTALTGNNATFIKYHSNAYVATGAAAKNSATLKSQSVVCGAKKVTASTGTMSKVESAVFEFSATDSRGFTTTQKVTKTLINYVHLTCNLDPKNPDVNGNMTFTISGNYFNGNFGAVANTLTLKYRFKEEDGEYGGWQTVTATKSGNTYSYTGSITGLDYRKAYRIEANATDKLESKSSLAEPIKSIPVFDWGKEDFNFNVPVTITDGYLVYPLLGLCRAMTKTYNCTVSVTAGDNYSSASGSATICGNILRCYVTATRSSAFSGDGANEVVASVSINHGGKISGMLNVSFSNGSSGAVASLYTSNVSQTEDTLDFNVYIAATAGSTTSISSYFQIPITINLDAY